MSDTSDRMPPAPATGLRAFARRAVWPAIAVAVALAAVAGAFSVDEIFYIRDLGFARWPEHLWFRAALRDGVFPLWDQYDGLGQSAIADPVHHLLFPPTLLLRLLLPEVLGFNLDVALPFPTAALGCYLFLRRGATAPAASLGAIVFAVSGPVMSTGNFINMSWAVALLPWTLLATDRLAESPSARRFSALALAFALEFLAGEAATAVSCGTLAVAYAAFVRDAGGPRRRAALVAVAAAAGIAGVLLAAFQAFPLAAAVSQSARDVSTNTVIREGWALHPLTFVELFTPWPFGDTMDPAGGAAALIAALNSGREPFIFSIYIGAPALALALSGAFSSGGRVPPLFWAAVFAAALVCALGAHTPAFPAPQAAVPSLRSVRYPSKFVVVAALAVAALVSSGWDLLAAREDPAARRGRRLAVMLLAIAAVAGLAAALLVFAMPSLGQVGIAQLASSLGIEDAQAVAEALPKPLGIALPRLVALSVFAAGCIALAGSSRPDARLGRAILFALVAFDVFAVGRDLNPTMEASRLREPPWVALTREHPADRVYIGGRFAKGGTSDTRDPDELVPENGAVVTGRSALGERSISAAFFATFPGAWRVRDSVSYDNNLLWPREYGGVMSQFRESQRDVRLRFLRGASVRYYFVPWRDFDGRMLVDYPDRAPLALFEDGSNAPRVSVVTEAEVVPELKDQMTRLFDPGFDPSATVIVDSIPPELAGVGASPEAPGASIVEDGTNTLSVVATAPEGGGFLVVRDSYNAGWHVDVDGEPATLLRANALFRAVRLASGRHMVRFSYWPRSLTLGVGVSGAVGLVLLAACVRKPRRKSA